MVLNLTRLAVVTVGERLVVATLSASRLETFVVDAEDPSAALRAEFGARKLRPRTVTLGLPRGSTTVKPIELPEVAGELRDMVKFELERHVPFPADDAPFAFAPLPRESHPGVAGGKRVLLAAADRRVVDGVIRIAQDVGLRPIAITVAAHDLVALAMPPAGRRVVWVHRSGADVDLLFLSGSTIVLSRNIAADDDAAVADEIRRSFSTARWRGAKEIWVSGDASVPADPPTGPLTEFGVPVVAPTYTRRARRHLRLMPPDSKGARMLAAAAVLARRSRQLDLIPDALRPRRLTRPQLITLGSAAAALVLALAALLMPGYRDRQRVVRVNGQIARLDPEVRAVERLVADLERKKKLVGTIEAVASSAIKPLPVLRELTELLPNDAWLTLVSFDPKGVELTGQAAAASALIPLLENSPLLERVEFASPVTRGRDREQFRIVAKWEPPPAEASAGPFRTPAVSAAPSPPLPSASAPAVPMGRPPRAATPGAAVAPPGAAAPMPPAGERR
jgi:Tfp pilus assembly protein PilN